jgi:hypothetical protein
MVPLGAYSAVSAVVRLVLAVVMAVFWVVIELSKEAQADDTLSSIASMAVLMGFPSLVLTPAQVISLAAPVEPSSVGGVAL